MSFRRLQALGTGFLAAALLSACGQERSAEAYCSAYQSGFSTMKADYPHVDQYRAANPLATFLTLPSAFGDMLAVLEVMEKAAPEEVESDLRRVRSTFEDQVGRIEGVYSDPSRALIGGAVGAIMNSGALARVDQYTVRHCGEHLFQVSRQQQDD